VASQDFNASTARESSPEFVEWHWHYHAPSMTLWAIGILLLVWSWVQRDTSGWRIVLPAVLAFVLWQMENGSVFTVTLAVTWLAIFLLNRRAADAAVAHPTAG